MIFGTTRRTHQHGRSPKEMKTTNLFHDLTRGHRRAGIIIAGATIAHLFFAFSPRVLAKLSFLWRSLRAFGIDDNSFSTCLLFLGSALLALLLLLTTIAIWVFSLAIAWAAFCRSRKKAYLFILAYFLLTIIVTPSSRVIRRHIATRQLRAYHAQQADAPTQIANPTPRPPPVAMNTTLKLSLPAGPLLLLAGLWYLYKKEEVANKTLDATSQ